MRKISSLLIIFLVLLTSVVFAEKIKSNEDYTGKRWYSVTDTKSSSPFSFGDRYKITTTFNETYEANSTKSVKKYVLQYNINDINCIRPKVRFMVDGKKWEIMSAEGSTVNDNTAQLSWTLPKNFIDELVESKKDITVRFFYNTANGDFFQDYVIPHKVISNVKVMYSQY